MRVLNPHFHKFTNRGIKFSRMLLANRNIVIYRRISIRVKHKGIITSILREEQEVRKCCTVQGNAKQLYFNMKNLNISVIVLITTKIPTLYVHEGHSSTLLSHFLRINNKIRVLYLSPLKYTSSLRKLVTVNTNLNL